MTEEVAWGEAQELDVVRLWVKHSELGPDAKRFVKSLDFDPYDVLVLADKGLPLCALEVKVRRVKFGEYGDVLTPLKKHEFALQLLEMNIPYLLVTLYACGTIVEVNLGDAPLETKPVSRRDRPGMTPVMHGLWKGHQLDVLREAVS